MNPLAIFAWKYIILPLIIKVAQKEISDFFAQMSLSDFIEWVSSIKTYQEYPNKIEAKSTCNLKTKDGREVNG